MRLVDILAELSIWSDYRNFYLLLSEQPQNVLVNKRPFVTTSRPSGLFEWRRMEVRAVCLFFHLFKYLDIVVMWDLRISPTLSYNCNRIRFPDIVHNGKFLLDHPANDFLTLDLELS